MEGIMAAQTGPWGGSLPQAKGAANKKASGKKAKQPVLASPESSAQRKQKPKPRGPPANRLSGQLDGSDGPEPQNTQPSLNEARLTAKLIDLSVEGPSEPVKEKAKDRPKNSKAAFHDAVHEEAKAGKPKGEKGLGVRGGIGERGGRGGRGRRGGRGGRPGRGQANVGRNGGDHRLKKEATEESTAHERKVSPQRLTKYAETNVVGTTKIGCVQYNADNIDPYDFYRTVNAQHQAARAQNTIFSPSLQTLHIHKDLLHANMRTSLPEDDSAVINGFSQCRNTVDRLLTRVHHKDSQWSAQLQQMADEYEARLAEQKAVGERMLSQRQMELERWQERCEQLQQGSRAGGKLWSPESRK